MRSRSRSSRADAAVRAAVIALFAGLAVGCSPGEPESGGDAPDRVLTGPQGAVGQFAVECGFDRFLPDDPIVMPGRAVRATSTSSSEPSG